MNVKQKILIADDSEINRALLMEILGDGYEYLEAENGVRAVELLQENGFSPRQVRFVHGKPGEEAQLALVMARRGLGESQILPPLVLRDEMGEYTQEYRRIHGVMEEE